MGRKHQVYTSKEDFYWVLTIRLWVSKGNYRVLGEYKKKACILELKRRYFEDYYSDNQYAVSIKEDTAYPCLHSPKTTKERRSIRRIQRRPIRRIGDIVCEDSGRYQAWSILQETPIRRIQPIGYTVSNRLPDSINRKLKNEF
ncbi:hypothetical protein Tco_0327406 [Tanacetum coccineum]